MESLDKRKGTSQLLSNNSAASLPGLTNDLSQATLSVEVVTAGESATNELPPPEKHLFKDSSLKHISLPHLKLAQDNKDKKQDEKRSKSSIRVLYSHRTVESTNVVTTGRKTSVATQDLKSYSSKPDEIRITTQRKQPSYRLFETEGLVMPSLPTQTTRKHRVLKDERRKSHDSKSSKNDINLTIS